MKKLLGILVLAFLFSANANAGVNEPGLTPISGLCDVAFSHEYKKLKKIYLESDKKEQVVLYGACDKKTGIDNYAFGIKKGKNLKKLHKQAYKACSKQAKKKTHGIDCYLYSVNEEVVWIYEEDKRKVTELAKKESEKAEKEKREQIDKKPGRFFEDQPDVNDDYQIHIIYFLASDTKDKERDLNGWIEQQVKIIDELLFKLTKNKQRFKFDKRSDGKLDVTFVRMDKKTKICEWNMNYPDYYLTKNGFDNPKKIYLSFTDAVSGESGQTGVHHGYVFIGKASSHMARRGVHELLHGLGFAFPCTKGVKKKGKHTGNGILGHDLNPSLESLYQHGDSTCPDLKDSVYLTPTSEDPFDSLHIQCALSQIQRGNPPGIFYIPSPYIIDGRDDEKCSYKFNEYTSKSSFDFWE